jgi:hypothetical protein
MTNRTNKAIASLAVAACIVGLAAASAPAATITTADGSGADAQILKRSNNGGSTIIDTDTNAGDDDRIGVRTYDGGDTQRFDAVFLRFDVSAYVSGSFTGNTTLGLTKWRDSESGLDFQIYGLNDGLDNWIEGDGGTDDNPTGELDFDNAPGIDQSAGYPPNPVANVIDTNEASLIAAWSGFTGDEGDKVTFTSSDLTTFLNDDNDGLVTLILLRNYTTSTAAFDDFASKEATTLDSGSPTVSAGTYAPSLTSDATVIPEPASIVLLGLGGAVMLAGRKRRWPPVTRS